MGPSASPSTAGDSAVLRQIAVLRTGWLTTLMMDVNTVLVSR